MSGDKPEYTRSTPTRSAVRQPEDLDDRQPASPATASRSLTDLYTSTTDALQECRFPLLLFVISLAGFLLSRGFATMGNGPEALVRWDATWYRTLIEHRYFTDGDPYVPHNVVFFPLYPIACRLVNSLLRADAVSVMFLVSASATLLTFVLLYKVLVRHCTALTARGALALLALNPFAVFFFNGYTEPLFLLFIVTFFYFLLNREWPWAAAVTVGLASAVRPYGVLLSLVFVFELLRRHRRAHGLRFDLVSPLLSQVFLYLPVCLVGMMAFTAWLGYRFGDPLAFWHNMAAWDTSTGESIAWGRLLTLGPVCNEWLLAAKTPQPSGALLAGLTMFLITPLLLLVGYRRIHPAFAFFLLLMFLFFHAVSHHDVTRLVSIGRYLMVVFPFMVLLASFLGPAEVERYLSVWTIREPAALPCMCWRFICALPLLATIVLFAWLYLQNAVRFFRGAYI